MLNSFSHLDVFVFAANILIFIFAGSIFKQKTTGEKTSFNSKVFAVRTINLIILVLYVIALFISDMIKPISLSGLTLLLAFIFSHVLHVFIVRKFGREREIDGTEYHLETYQSEIFSVLVSLITVLATVIILINIWGMTDWLKATSVFGILALIIFSTKDIWIADNINGLILLYNNDVEPGAVVRIPELDLLAITVQTSLTQTSFRDLRQRHLIVIPNTRIRTSKIEILTRASSKGLFCYACFNIGYQVKSDKVEAFLTSVWETAVEKTQAINPEKVPQITTKEVGDHAVTWRLGYWLKNAYQLYEAELIVNRVAFDLSHEHGIELQTPLTHDVLHRQAG